MPLPVDLIFVRHGQSEGNVALDEAKNGGDPSALGPRIIERSSRLWALTDLGARQAQAAGAWLRSNGPAIFDRYLCSPYVRAMSTAGHLGLPDATWQLESLLRERDRGHEVPATREEHQARFPDSVESKRQDPFLWRPTMGESIADVDQRARDVFGSLAREHPAGAVLCVTHEDMMWAVRYRLEKMTIGQWIEGDRTVKIPNCSILWYSRRDRDGVVHPKNVRVRLIDPAHPDGARTVFDQEVERRRFSNDELLRLAELEDAD